MSIALPHATRIADGTAQRIVEAGIFMAGMAIARNIEKRHGLYLFVGTPGRDSPHTYFHEPVGIVPPDKAEKYMALSMEKPWRAYRNGHVTSYESRDPVNNMYAGGVVANDWLIGWSGLNPDAWDDAGAVLTAVLSGLKPVDWAMEIADHHTNGYIVSFMADLGLLDNNEVDRA